MVRSVRNLAVERAVLETVTFSVYSCEPCAGPVLAAWDLDEHDELVPVCARCGARLEPAADARRVGASALRRFGYDVEGEGPVTRGCGSGGSCGSCSSSSTCGTP